MRATPTGRELIGNRKKAVADEEISIFGRGAQDLFINLYLMCGHETLQDAPQTWSEVHD